MNYVEENATKWVDISLGDNPSEMIPKIESYMRDTGITESYIIDDFVISMCGYIVSNVLIVHESEYAGYMGGFLDSIEPNSKDLDGIVTCFRAVRLLKILYPEADTGVNDMLYRVIETGVPHSGGDFSVNLVGIIIHYMNNARDPKHIRVEDNVRDFKYWYFSTNILLLLKESNITPVSTVTAIHILCDVYKFISIFKYTIECRESDINNREDIMYNAFRDITSPDDLNLVTTEYNAAFRKVFESVKECGNKNTLRKLKVTMNGSMKLINDSEPKIDNYLKLIN